MAHSFESLSSAAVRRRLSSTIDTKKPYVTATYASLTVSIGRGAHRGLSLLIIFFLADVGRSRRRCDQ
jgi:hypothetical protein